MQNLTNSFETVRVRVVCLSTSCKCVLIMYVDFHTLYPLPLPLGFVLLSFCTSMWRPRLTFPTTQTWGASCMRPFTTQRQPLITPRILSTPASSIAPHPRRYTGSLRLRLRSRALAAHAFRHRPLDPSATLNPSGGFVWTPVQQIVGRPPSLRAAFVPSYPTRTLASLVLRCPTPFQKSFYLVKFRWFKCFGSFSSN